MKRIFTLILCAVILAGCTTAPSDNLETPTSVETKPAAENPDETISEVSGETEGQSTPSDEVAEMVLVDEAGIKITAKSLDKSGWMGPELKLLIENNTEKNLTVQVRNSSVNGYMISTSMSEDVAAGKKANGEITFLNSSIKAAGIDTFADIEFSFHVMDEEWETYFDTDIITVKTAAAESYSQVYDDSGVEIFNSNGVRVISKGLNNGDIFGVGVVFYAYNGSEQPVIISDLDCSVNGFMLDPNLYIELAPGKHAIDDMDFFSSDLEENEITDINEIEFALHVYNGDTWDDIAVSEPITLNFE